MQNNDPRTPKYIGTDVNMVVLFVSSFSDAEIAMIEAEIETMKTNADTIGYMDRFLPEVREPLIALMSGLVAMYKAAKPYQTAMQKLYRSARYE